MERHEYSKLFPDMSVQEYQSLVQDVRQNGLIDPVIFTYEGMILDGWHRYNAAQEIGVEVDLRLYAGESPLDFVASRNMHRRHLTPAQRAQVEVHYSERLQLGSNRYQQKVESPNGNSKSKPVTREDMAQRAGVSKRTIDRAIEVEKDSPNSVEKVIAGEVTPEEVKRDLKELDRAKRLEERKNSLSVDNTDLPTGQRYAVIYADPPWQYDFSRSLSREVENQYSTMTLEEIKALDVDSICHKDAVLYLWTTAPKLVEALDVIQAWGFTYKTHACWIKQKWGMGYWFRSQHELILVGTRGSFPPPDPDDRIASVFNCDRGEHSKKPDFVADYLNDLYPDMAKMELFNRGGRYGWDVWGDESG